jgi:hypothetical protein
MAPLYGIYHRKERKMKAGIVAEMYSPAVGGTYFLPPEPEEVIRVYRCSACGYEDEFQLDPTTLRGQVFHEYEQEMLDEDGWLLSKDGDDALCTDCAEIPQLVAAWKKGLV